MQKFITLGVEENEINLTYTSKISASGYTVRFDDIDEGCINEVYVTGPFTNTSIQMQGCATINLEKDYVSLHIMSGPMLHKEVLDAIFRALLNEAASMKAAAHVPSSKTQLSGCGVHSFYVD